MDRRKNVHTTYADRVKLWYSVILDDGGFEILMKAQGQERPQRYVYEPANGLHSYSWGLIRFVQGGKEMRVLANEKDRTKLLFSGYGRMLSYIRISDDNGLSMSRLDRNNWPDNDLPYDMARQISAVVRLANNASGIIKLHAFGDDQVGQFRTELATTGPIMILPARFDPVRAISRRQALPMVIDPDIIRAQRDTESNHELQARPPGETEQEEDEQVAQERQYQVAHERYMLGFREELQHSFPSSGDLSSRAYSDGRSDVNAADDEKSEESEALVIDEGNNEGEASNESFNTCV